MIEPPYNFKYHAEIRYETEDCFSFTNANGNTIPEFQKDVEEVCNKYAKRNPKIVTILGKSMISQDYKEYVHSFASSRSFVKNSNVKKALNHIIKDRF